MSFRSATAYNTHSAGAKARAICAVARSLVFFQVTTIAVFYLTYTSYQNYLLNAKRKKGVVCFFPRPRTNLVSSGPRKPSAGAEYICTSPRRPKQMRDYKTDCRTCKSLFQTPQT